MFPVIAHRIVLICRFLVQNIAINHDKHQICGCNCPSFRASHYKPFIILTFKTILSSFCAYPHRMLDDISYYLYHIISAISHYITIIFHYIIIYHYPHYIPHVCYLSVVAPVRCCRKAEIVEDWFLADSEACFGKHVSNCLNG